MNKDILTGFGARLKLIRQNLKMNQDQFSKELNFANTAISGFENGKYGPGFDFFYNIVKRFNVNLNFLLFGEGTMYNHESTPESPTNSEDPSPETRAEKNFLFYFKNSEIVKFHTLTEFRRFMIQEKNLIEKDIQEGKK
ncbi:MAG: helix-turn-helix domain-containing protein [Candidatus Omnitrophota bacterium]